MFLFACSRLSVAVVSDEGAAFVAGASLVLSKSSCSVGSGTGQQSCLSSFTVLGLSEPGLKDRLLEGTAVREGECPRLGDVGERVHIVEIERSLLLRLTSGEESDTWKGWHDGTRQSSDGVPGNFLGRLSIGAGRAWGDHVGLKQGTFDDQVVVQHGLHDGGKHTLGHLGADIDAVASILEDLGLNDGHESILLADGSVAGKRMSGLSDGKLGGHTVTNLEDSSPLGEAAAHVVELLGALGKAVKASGGSLAIGSHQLNETLVKLDASMDATTAQELDEVGAVSSSLTALLLKEDHATDVLLNAWGSEEELAVSSTVFFSVLNVDGGETLSNGASALVSSKDTLASRSDLLGGPD